MGNFDDEIYNERYSNEKQKAQRHYEEIIKSFENMTLEEKVNKLIELYAFDEAFE